MARSRAGQAYDILNFYTPLGYIPDLVYLGLSMVENVILGVMADSRIGTDQDGLFVTVRTRDGLPVCAPQVDRAVNIEPCFIEATEFIDNPDNYEKPERLTGLGKGPDAVHDGGPGYIPYHRVSFGPRGFRVMSTRPFHPILSLEARIELADWVSDWIAAGVIPNHG